MHAQSLVVGFIVLACALHAAWVLMPASTRRFVATRLLRLRLPSMVARPFRRALSGPGSCGGCDSCGETAGPAREVKTVTVHRRREG